MKKIVAIALITVILLLSVSCNKTKEEYSEYSFMAMDTIINIKLYAKDIDAKVIFDKCEVLVHELESILSSHDTESQISKFNNSESGIENPDLPIRNIVEFALDINSKIGGDFDITAAPLLFMWQDNAEYNQLPSAEMIKDNKAHIGYDKIALTENKLSKTDPLCGIDLGGIGKGYALSKLKQLIIDEGIKHALINFGGNVAVIGSKPDSTAYVIGIKNPLDTSSSICYVSMVDSTVAVSGVYERYVTIGGEKYHHIIDPSTGYPADSGLLSVAVVCGDSTLADTLSTAFLVMGKDRAMNIYNEKIFEFEAIFVDSNGSLTLTKGLENKVTY